MKHRFTSLYVLRTICISVIVLLPCAAFAQQKEQPATGVAPGDTAATFRGIEIGADVVGLIEQWVGHYGQYEAMARASIKDKYFPALELGYGKADITEATTNNYYHTAAPYIKIGVDFNLLKNKHDDYRLYAGVRYAFTSFKVDVSNASITDPVWQQPVTLTVNGNKANCHWAELLFAVDAKIWGPVRMGWSARYLTRLAYNNGDIGNVWYVPGFGKQGHNRLNGTFNIMIEL